jgi:hypothetical protein
LRENNFKSLADLATNKELNEIKEIMTFLINDQFNGFIDWPDLGYPDHSKMRMMAEINWKKNKDLNKLIIYLTFLHKKYGRL